MTRLPAGMRNNNPGNIKFNPDVLWDGLVGPSVNTDQGDPQAVFQSPELGMRAAAKLALNKYKKGMRTANQLIAAEGGWTPGNAQAAANVAKSAGIGPDDDLGLDDPAKAQRFLRALVLQEHGPASNQYPDSMITGGITAAGSSQPESKPMATDWIRYANAGATRSQPLKPELVKALSFLPELGVTMDVFSGGQPSSGPNRTGSHRHDDGGAGDVFFSKGGRRLDWANPEDVPIFQSIVAKAKERGVTGFGAGKGYMQPGSMHIGFGSPAVWGAGGSGANAPDWLRSAFGQTALSPEAADFVKNNPQPGGFGAGIPDPNAPPVFGSMSAGLGQQPQSGIDPGVANFAFGDDKPSMGDRFSAAGKAFDSAMSEVKAPRIAQMPSPSGDVANGLAKLMQNPQALAQLLMKQRLA